MTFYVGQKVVCVNASGISPGSNRGWSSLCDVPTEGAVYTVRSVERTFRGLPGLKLEEIIWRGINNGVFLVDFPYWADRFRPVVERKTDISLFKAMLTPSMKERERV